MARKQQDSEQVEAILEQPNEQVKDSEQEQTDREVVEKIKVVFIESTKHNETRYKVGQKEEVTVEDYAVLLAAGVIQSPEE